MLFVPVSARAADAPAPNDWPQFLGPTRDGVYAGKDVAADWPADGPKTLWQKKVGQGFAGPVVSGESLVLFHRVGDKEVVDCLDARTGAAKWSADDPTAYVDSFGFDPGPRATPSVSDGKVYTFGADGRVSCRELATGKSLWSIETRKSFKAEKGYFGAACSPLVEGEVVILNLGGADGAGIVAFDKATGAVRWKATDDAAGYSSPTAATINGKRYVFAFTRAGLVALDGPTGKVYWSFPWRARMDASVNAATPLIAGGDIFVSASYGTGAALLAFDEAKPKEVWSGDDALSNHYATAVIRDGFLYGYHGRQEEGPSLRCVELKTGKVRWTEDNFGAGTLLLVNDRLLILTEKGQLLSAPASPEAFKPGPRTQILPFEARAHPALANGLFYARSKDKLVCVNLRAGK